MKCLKNPFTLNNFIMHDCDYIVRGDTANSYIIYGNGVALTLNNVVFHNNVFHNIKKQDNSTTTDFKFIHGYRSQSANGTTVVDLTVTSNTLSYVLTKNTGFIYAYKMTGKSIIKNNFWVETQPKNAIIPVITANAAEGAYAETFATDITANYFYVKDTNKALNVSSIPSNGTRNTPVSFTFNPLSDNWAPENGVFGYKDNLQYYGTFNTAGTEKNVSSTTNGAQRKTSAAVVNRAGYNYSSEELGNL